MRRFEIAILGLMFLLALALALPAQAAGNDNVSKIICNGEGKTTAAPDIVTITLGVETRNVSASAAAAENAKLMNSTINALLSAGLNKKDIQTSQYSLTTQPEDNPVPASATKNKTPPVFVATNQVTAKMNVTENIGKVLDAATAAGSNSVMGISFDLRDPKPQMDKALANAVNDSRRKAEIMAGTAGLKLGKILELSEGYGYTSSNAPRAAYSVAEATTPVLPGEMEITASVTVTYEITK
ncbi:MAG: SIMPL domain-containing protein [Methanotrichaceae archaeon]|jgi:uncharacterized protein YggE